MYVWLAQLKNKNNSRMNQKSRSFVSLIKMQILACLRTEYETIQDTQIEEFRSREKGKKIITFIYKSDTFTSSVKVSLLVSSLRPLQLVLLLSFLVSNDLFLLLPFFFVYETTKLFFDTRDESILTFFSGEVARLMK